MSFIFTAMPEFCREFNRERAVVAIVEDWKGTAQHYADQLLANQNIGEKRRLECAGMVAIGAYVALTYVGFTIEEAAVHSNRLYDRMRLLIETPAVSA